MLEKADVLGSRPILIGGGTDGASVNIAQQNGMRGKMQRHFRGFFGGGAMLTGWSWPAKILSPVIYFRALVTCYSVCTTSTPSLPRT